MNNLQKYLKRRSLDIEIQYRVKNYYAYLEEQRTEVNEIGGEMVENLANSIKDEIKQNIYGKMLNNLSLFRLNFSSAFLNLLSLSVKEKQINPEEFLFEAGKPHEQIIYFLIEGTINYILEEK